ncbi:MAG TPA: hypothetical protein VFS18_03470, partial [Actinomycetota bacterium]|nr:hypothetical protein [Actinomycetota bacterium]
MKKLAVFVTLCLIASAAAYFVYLSDELPEMTIEATGGRVVLVRDDKTITIDGTNSIRTGDFITTSDGGSARLRLAGERRAFIGESARIVVTSESSLEGRSGRLRVNVAAPTEVLFSDVTASTSRAHFRVDVGVGAARVGSYRGDVALDAPGEPALRLRSLFEVQTAAGQLPG